MEGPWPEDLPRRIERLPAASASLPREPRGKTYDLQPRILPPALDGNALRMRLSLLPDATGRPDEMLAALEAGDIAAVVRRERLVPRETGDGP